MLKTSIKLSAAALSLMLCATAFAQNAAVVNGQPLPSSLLDFIMKEQAKRGQAPTDEMRTAIRQQLINQEVLKQEAVKKGLANNDDVKYQIEMMKQAVLANALHEDFIKNTKISDKEVQDTYDKIAKMMGGEEYRASHILVKTKKEAEDIIAKLNKGAKFADLAKKDSQDPGSAKNGGDLDWANPNSFVPEFSKAMVALKKGEYTKEPVKTQFGYHVILLTDKREAKPPKLADIRPQLEQKMLNDKWTKYEQELVSKATVK